MHAGLAARMKSLLTGTAGLALVLAMGSPPALAQGMSVPASPLNPNPVCLGNGFTLAGDFVEVTRDPLLSAREGLVDGRPSQFSWITFQESLLDRVRNDIGTRATRVELIAVGSNTVLHRLDPKANFEFMLATGRNGSTGAVNNPNSYLAQSLQARVVYDLTTPEGNCTVTLVSNRLGPVSSNTQYTPFAPVIGLAPGQANLAPGSRAQISVQLGNILAAAGTPEPLARWTLDYGYADSDGAAFDTCRGADGGPSTSSRLDSEGAARGDWSPGATVAIDIPANVAGKWLCVRHRIQSLNGRATSSVAYRWIQGPAVAPRAPTITLRNPLARFEVGQEFTLALETTGTLAPGEQLLDRLWYHNWVDSADADCNIGLDRPIQYRDLDRHTVVFRLPSIMAGKWFCAKQIVQTTSGVKSSPVVYRRVLARPGADVPLLPPRPAAAGGDAAGGDAADDGGAGGDAAGGGGDSAGGEGGGAGGAGGNAAGESEIPAAVDVPAALVAAGVDGAVTPLLGLNGDGTYKGLTLKVRVPTVQVRGKQVRAAFTVTPRTKGQIWFTFTRTNAAGKVIVGETRKVPVRGTAAKARWTFSQNKPAATYLLIVRFVPSKKGTTGAMVTKPILVR